MTVPGVSITGAVSVLPPGLQTDSVDGDDGLIDGSGTGGHLLYSSAETIRFTFDASALGGRLPTHAGIVWTDVGTTNSGTVGSGPVTFEAFGPLGASLGTIGPFTLGDGVVTGTTAEDRFFGITNAPGISAIEIRMPSRDWEVDHLQFGAAAASVPEPASIAFVAIGAIAMSLLAARHAVRTRRSGLH